MLPLLENNIPADCPAALRAVSMAGMFVFGCVLGAQIMPNGDRLAPIAANLSGIMIRRRINLAAIKAANLVGHSKLLRPAGIVTARGN